MKDSKNGMRERRREKIREKECGMREKEVSDWKKEKVR